MTQTFNLKIARDVSWNTELHWVDASETDQGAAGSGESVKDIVDAVGATKNATMIFSHSGSGNTTTYSFGTSETIPTNIDVIVEAGARLAIATGVTLTI
ncbi:MAG: hypothetical protein KKH70_20430, partial [Gammaproteobacteria bacterium]|nr:hypothetical protein [Gammaproteobacteria bacterium]